MIPAPFAVVSKRRETSDTWTLELEPAAGDELSFAPGQFTMLSRGGTGEVPISISGDPARPARLVHTVRAVGLATQAICATEPGDALGVRGPFGGAWPVEAAEGADVLVVSGGIGLAPLRPAILALLARRARYGRLVLLYGGRSPGQLLYPAELDEWSARGLEIAVTVDSAGPEWLGHVGVVPRLVRRAAFDAGGVVALLCGPEVMMRFAAAVLIERGVAAERVYASMERNMQCGIGVCGHCQLGPTLVCRDGPVYRWDEIAPWLAIREL
ncbi:MAG TPA: FAD/NAD(P)-binding protein [Solirubrobacteraceae bacterium]|nr:FAD/NAD(P)-binding protein [Solirubrobacteraceae bacterium]